MSLHGEFALRGEVADIYPHAGGEALRLVFDLDRLAELKGFDPLSQASTRRRQEARVPPVREVVFSPELAKTLRRRLASLGGQEQTEALLERLALDPGGIRRGVPGPPVFRRHGLPAGLPGRGRASFWSTRSAWRPARRRCARSTSSCTAGAAPAGRRK